MAGRIGPVSSRIVRTRNGAGNSAVLIGASDPFANRHPSKPLRGFYCQAGNHSPQGNVDLDSFDHGGRTNAGPTSPFPCAKELVFPAMGYPPPAKPSARILFTLCSISKIGSCFFYRGLGHAGYRFHSCLTSSTAAVRFSAYAVKSDSCDIPGYPAPRPRPSSTGCSTRLLHIFCTSAQRGHAAN